MIHTVLNWLPGPLITTLHDTADAAAWLAHTRAGQPRSFALPQRQPGKPS